MRILSILIVCVVAVVQGRLEVEHVQTEAIRIHIRGGSSDLGLTGDSTWYCERDHPNGNSGQKVAQASKQVYFVQPPSKKYKHNIFLRGQNEQQQQNSTADIYVLPAKNSHEIELHGAESGPLVKPSFFFLKQHPFVNQSVSVSVRSAATPSSPYQYPRASNRAAHNNYGKRPEILNFKK